MPRSIVPRPRTAALAACLLVLSGPGTAEAREQYHPHHHGRTPASAARLLALVNEERRRAGCGPLVLDRRLSASARRHSGDMALRHRMSHQGSDGSAPVDRIKKSGYRVTAWAENVAHGYRTDEEVMDAWMSSPEHRANILNCDYRQMGIARAEPGHYWTQDFGSAG